MPLIFKVIRYKGQPISEPMSMSFDRKGGTIGRNPSNDLVLTDPHISRQHAEIIYINGCYYLKDTSINGTYIRNKKIHVHKNRIKLEDGDKIEIGNYELLVILCKIAETPAPQQAEPAAPSHSLPDQVEFAVFSPKKIVTKSFFIFDVWAYFHHQYSAISGIEKALGREKTLGRKIGIPVRRGSFLTVSAEIRDLEIQDPIDTIIWNGSPTNASFIVNVPEHVKIGYYPGKVIIRHHGITIAKIVFPIEIAADSNSERMELSEKRFYPRTAFASYSRGNREQVLARIQGMKKIAPNLDVFVDVLSLRSGQNWQNKLDEHVPNKDIFYLFWSQKAACSKWVEREWRLALQRRGINYIDPVPLEEPESAPPPRELASLHFNDAYLAYISYETLKAGI